MCPLPGESSNSDCQYLYRKRVIGFDAKNKNSLTSYICRICNLILRYPCQLYCGHRFCKTCLDFEEESLIKCIRCNEETPKEKIMPDKGCQHDMQNLDISCSLCDWNGIFKNYQEHLDKFHSNPFCKYCGQYFDSADSFNQHTFICEHIPIDCILKPYGCQKQFLRMNAQEHLLSEEHQTLLLKFLTQKFSPSINDLDDQQLASAYTTVSRNRITDETLNSGYQELHEMLEHLLGGVQALSDDTQRLTSESLLYQNTLQSFSEDLSKVKVATQETNSLLDAHRSNQQIFEQNLSSLQQEVDDMKNTSYDGTFIWKITNFSQKIADAQSERQTSIYSPAFYSSPNGYKMRIRLYPVGDGNARRTHMSLFFVLMRGEYDAILQFPFNFKVNFCLFDQTPQQRHLTDSFRPDAKSNSFQRPRSDMNIASGIPKFCPLPIIQQDNNPYVRDDTILIKIMVDFGSMPKTMLSYTLSLNPGLPIAIQHELIKKELEKRSKESVSDIPQAATSIKSEVN